MFKKWWQFIALCDSFIKNIDHYIRVITKLPNSEQCSKGKVKTHKYINKQNQSTTGKLWKLFCLIFKSYLNLYHLLVPNVVREACVSNMYICSLIGFNRYFVLYLMCCFGNNPLYMDFKPIKIIFYSVWYTTGT